MSYDNNGVHVKIDFEPSLGTYQCKQTSLDSFKKEMVNQLLELAKKTLNPKKRKTVIVELIENNIKIQEYTFSAV